MELTSREVAYVILIGIFILLSIVIPGPRKAVISASRSFFVVKIIFPLATYLAYAGLIAFLGYRLDFWSISLVKETVYVVLFVGIPVLVNAVTKKNETQIFRRTLGKTLGFTALLGIYVGLEPLPLWGELILLPFLTVCVLMSTFAKSSSEQEKKVGSCFETLTGITGTFLLVFTTVQVIRKFDDYEWDAVLGSLFLSVWFAIALLPFIYVFAFIAGCESALVMLPFFNDGKKPKLRTRIGLVLGLHFSIRLSKLFVGSKWHRYVALTETFKDSLEVMGKFRHDVRRRAKSEAGRLNVLKKNAGAHGTDSESLAIDRREFFETKKALRKLSDEQMNARKTFGEYKPDLLKISGLRLGKELPKKHELHVQVRKDQAAWLAWRGTPGGWYFGVAGTEQGEARTFFSNEPPASSPENHPNWVNDDELSMEWEKDDGPIRPS